MKRIIIALLILPLFIACNQKELEQLKADKVQLTETLKQKEVSLNEFVSTLNSIEENLEIIKEKEKIVAVASETPTKSQKQKIAKNIAAINNLIEQNNAKIAELDKKLKNSWYQNSKLRKLTERLKADVAQKEADITAMKEQIAQLDVKVEGLNANVAKLDTAVAELTTENADQANTISERTTSMNTAYYVVGSTSELKAKNVIAKKAGIIGIGAATVLNENANTKEFEKIDITETTLIPVEGKKIKMVTTHPANSYKFEAGKGITITNADAFWKSSKFLVVKAR
jgi:predicted nuclease with TOPRIM domain